MNVTVSRQPARVLDLDEELPLPMNTGKRIRTANLLSRLARRFDINPNQLLEANGMSAGSLYSPGMTLTIPQGASPFPGERALLTHPATYTVVSGDTIYGVACKYGDVWPEAIAAANGLVSPYTLTAGQTLQIP